MDVGRLARATPHPFRGAGSGGGTAFHLPVPGQQVVDPLCGIIEHSSEDIGEPGLRIDVVELGGLDQRVDGSGPPAAFVGAGECPVVASDRNAHAARARRRCWTCTGGRRRGSG